MRTSCAIILLFTISLAVRAESKEEPKFEGKHLSEWLRALKDPDSATRYHALEAVFRMGADAKEALPAVREILKDPMHRMRFGAVVVLGRFGAEGIALVLDATGHEDLDQAARLGLRPVGAEAVAPLQRFLSDSSPHRRAAAAAALGWVGPGAREALPALHHALEDADGLVRVQAAGAIQAIDPANSTALAPLLDGLRNKDETVRRQAAELLGAVSGKESVSALRAALKDSAVSVSVSAAAALCRLERGQGKEFLPLLIEGLKGTNYRAFQNAAQALTIVGPEAKTALPALLDTLKNPDPLMARIAAMVVPYLGRDDPAAFKALVSALKYPEVEVRVTVCAALGKMTVKDSSAVPALEEVLKDKEDLGVRTAAASALASLGTAGKPAVPALTAALKDAEGRVRLSVASALLHLDPKATAAVPVLAELLQHPEDGLRQQAAAEVRRQGRTLLPILKDALQDKDPAVRGGAAQGLGALGPTASSVVALLNNTLKDDVPAVRVEAAIALCRLSAVNPGVVGPLLDGLKTGDRGVRRRAAESLAVVGPRAKEAIPALLNLMKDPANAPGRAAAARALGMVGAEAKMVGPALGAALKDDSPLVRLAAAEALLKLGPASQTGEPIAVLIALLGDKTVATRTQGVLIKAGPAALPGLLQALKDKDPDARRGAIGVLGQLGVKKEEVAPALTTALKDEAAPVRLAAVAALLRIEGDAEGTLRQVLPVWTAALKDSNAAVRQQILGAASQHLLRTKARDLKALLPLVLTGLQDAESAVRQQAFQILSSAKSKDPEVLAALSTALKTPNHPGCVEVIQALRPFGQDAKSAAPALIALLKSHDEKVQLAAVQALPSIARGDRAAVAALSATFQNKTSPALRREAAVALGGMGDGARGAIPALTGGLQDDAPKVRQAVVTALARIGAGPEEYLPTLIEILGRAETPTKAPSQGQEILRGKEKALTPVLAKLLRDASPDRRLGAAIALHSLDTQGAEAAPALVEALKDDDTRVRVRAAEALWRVTQKPEPALTALLETFKDKDANHRRRAVVALGDSLRPRTPAGQVPPTAPPSAPVDPALRKAVPVLLEALRDADEVIVFRAIQDLGYLRAEAKPAVPALAALAKGKASNALRQGAIQALGAIGPDAKTAVPELMAALKDPNPSFLPLAADALSRVGADPKEVAPVLVQSLRTGERVGTLPIMTVLRRLGPETTPEVAKLLQNAPVAVRSQAADVLGSFGPKAKAAVPALKENLKDEQMRVAISAAKALWQIEQSTEGVSALIKGLSAREALLRLQAAQTLGGMGPKAKEAVPALQLAAKDKDAKLRRMAQEALQKIDPDTSKP